MGIITVLWEKWVEFRRDFYKITLAAMISPLMYLLIFGFGIQTTSHGEPSDRFWAVRCAACMLPLSFCCLRCRYRTG